MASCDNEGTVYLNGKKSRLQWQLANAHESGRYQPSGGRRKYTSRVDCQSRRRGRLCAQTNDAKQGWRDQACRHRRRVENCRQDSDRHFPALRAMSPVTVAMVPARGVVSSTAQTYEGRVPANTFEVQPGFVVEKLFTVPREQLGSLGVHRDGQQGPVARQRSGQQGNLPHHPAADVQ